MRIACYGWVPANIIMHTDILTFRKTMGQFATGVTVVTTLRDGIPYGLTVNSFTSVSLDPLQILVCISRSSVTHAHVEATGCFAVSILAEDQHMVSTVFAGAPMSDRFDAVKVRPAPSGCPIIEGSIAWIDARVVQAIDSGDHTIFIAEATAMDIMAAEAPPLLYHRGRYARLAPASSAAGSA
jgi:flavin reductase (DIM6/NTAB) family NADH-FMN oxidoreductase RutF